MIEKFSPEELRQIKKELGIIEPEFYKKKDVLKDEKLLVEELVKNKCISSQRAVSIICTLIDLSINNTRTIRGSKVLDDGQVIDGRDAYAVTIKVSDYQEYREMFHEILDIIKNHNRPYIEDGVKNPE